MQPTRYSCRYSGQCFWCVWMHSAHVSNLHNQINRSTTYVMERGPFMGGTRNWWEKTTTATRARPEKASANSKFYVARARVEDMSSNPHRQKHINKKQITPGIFWNTLPAYCKRDIAMLYNQNDDDDRKKMVIAVITGHTYWDLICLFKVNQAVESGKVKHNQWSGGQALLNQKSHDFL